MALTNPFSQLTGALKLYIAAYGEAIPDVNTLPAGNWVELGSTDGDQKVKHIGKVQVFYDNDHQGPVASVRHEEGVTIGVKLVDLTLEHYARVISAVGNVQAITNGSSVATKKLPLKRGAAITEYAVLLYGSAISPYGVFPGMYVIPRAKIVSEPEPTFGKNNRAALDVNFETYEDDAQPEADKLGWLVVQIS